MQVMIPQAAVQPASRKIVPAGYTPATFDELGADEEDLTAGDVAALNPEKAVDLLYEGISPVSNFKDSKDKGLYFAGRKPDCTIVGLARNGVNRSNQQMDMIKIMHVAEVRRLVRESAQPYQLFVLDALPYDAFSAVHAIMQEISGKGQYYQRQPVVSVVEKGVEGLVSKLSGQFSGTPLRFIAAKKYGEDIIDAQLLGQVRY